MLRVLIIYCIVIGYAVSAKLIYCNDISECPKGQCCYSPILITSKRRVEYGWCEPYQQIGEPCGGSCGCAQGLTCYYSGLINSRAVAAKIAPTGGICVPS